jgi:hypothetical protein
MTSTKLNSSLIDSVDYADGTLTIHFTNGKDTQYVEVPREVVAELISSPSPGRYYNSRIRSKYSH